LQRADLEQRRRERFKRAVVATVAALTVLLVVLLIEGCMTEHAKNIGATTGGEAAPAVLVVTPAPKPAATLAAKPVAPAPVATATIRTSTTPTSLGAEVIYVVKPNDTLVRIAKLHQTTVKALKAFNGLSSDLIGVGTKLKLPTA